MYKRGRLQGPSASSPSRSMSRSRSPSRARGFTKQSIKSSPATKFQPVSKGPERKFVDTTGTYVVPQIQTGTINLVNGIAQGAGNSQRVGFKVTMTSISVKGNFLSTSAANPNGACRIKLVYDKQTNLALPVATDILVADAVGAPNNLINGDRFITLMDQQIHPDAAISTFGGSYCAYDIDFFTKCQLPMVFGGVGATVASIETGGLYLLAYYTTCGGAAAPSAIYGQNIYVRVRYTDN